ncbi:DUF488 family protein [Rhodococcus opacus]|uniref:DUF488 domain-containing protein n=1 Tax=Rhodococcus opacus TaxID=37919 RepID=UPI0007CD7852|nr:DUF488 family protein [Rhodococcus opacus]MDX5969837.1 DUF488 family protein [Rhodococcus opacus]MDX5969978.1 DUF488 family protein [Rhodococcus opacus]CAG7635572.1 hypothetical protein E143388_07692 [Rhodococcus opacus]
MGPIELVRAYDARGTKKASPTFLVDRLWPRGIAKADLDCDAWIREVAPSTELRTWFGHQADRFPEFRTRYLQELDTNRTAAQPIVEAARHGTVVLLYSAKDLEHNQAVVLREWISNQF